MIIRWSPSAYNGQAAYQSAVFVRTWMPTVAAFVAPAGGGISHYLLLLGVGR